MSHVIVFVYRYKYMCGKPPGFNGNLKKNELKSYIPEVTLCGIIVILSSSSNLLCIVVVIVVVVVVVLWIYFCRIVIFRW